MWLAEEELAKANRWCQPVHLGPFNCFAGASREFWIVEQVPDRGVGIRDGRNHAMSSRPKVENISARFWSISSSEGPGPYCDQIPRRDSFAVLTGKTCSGKEDRIGSMAWRTTCSGVVPASRAFARSLASS